MKRFILLLTIALCCCFLIAGSLLSWPDETVPKDKIFSFVNDNIESLEKFPNIEADEVDWSAESGENEGTEAEIIQEHLGIDSIVRDVYACNDNILRFYCGGSGFAGGSTYTGFYYSKDDTPSALDFDENKLSEIKEGVYQWSGEGGSHKIRTEKIRDNWYYYKLEWY